MSNADTNDTDSGVPPVVCTLTLGKKNEQKLEWGDLAPQALRRTEVDGGVTSVYSLDMADQIEDLADREMSCCGSWLSITHSREADGFHLTVTTTNPEGVALVRELAGL